MANNSRIEQIKEFLKKTPEDAFLNYALAMEYVSLGEEQKVQQILEKLLKDDPKYFATYYHLAKLYERQEDKPQAIATYEAGINMCKQLGEQHALRELQTAYDELMYD
ncbi:MAG: hypothetical protein JXR19_02115 [Bacteroidia bacterium]